jgi:hypothetical protein
MPDSHPGPIAAGVLSVALLAAPGIVAAGEVLTPPPGSPLRRDILDAVRTDVAADLPPPLMFRVHRLAVADGWAFLAATPQQPDGRPYDYRGTRYQTFIDDGVFDDNLFALLELEQSCWRVRAVVVGATDVPYESWSEQYGAPAAIFR